MKITSVNVRKVDSENRMRGIASVVLDECFAVHGIRIIEGDTVKLEMSPYDLTKGRITWRSKS